MRRWFGAAALLFGVARGAAAQTGVAAEGAAEFLLPVGARSVALGQAVVASVPGAEAIWWNPAGLVGARREFQLNSTTSLLGTEADLAAVAAYSLPHVMSFAAGIRYVNYGAQEAAVDGPTTGSFTIAGYVLAATFAAPFGDRLRIGTTLKMLTINFNCTGTCPNNPQNNPITGAVDAGVQYAIKRDSTILIGAAVRNLGAALQYNDSPQSDVLPGRFDAGLEFAPKLPQYPGLGVRASGSVVLRVGSEAANSGPGFRVGGEASWLNQYFGRAGYIHAGPGADSGPTLGFGLSRGRWQIDFAQFLSENTAAAGVRPTYISLRYSF